MLNTGGEKRSFDSCKGKSVCKSIEKMMASLLCPSNLLVFIILKSYWTHSRLLISKCILNSFSVKVGQRKIFFFFSLSGQVLRHTSVPAVGHTAHKVKQWVNCSPPCVSSSLGMD